MSKFLILNEDEIAKIHLRRAEEIFDIWERRDDSKWEDLLYMVAEALQITENKALGLEPYYPKEYLVNGELHSEDEVEEIELVPATPVYTKIV